MVFFRLWSSAYCIFFIIASIREGKRAVCFFRERLEEGKIEREHKVDHTGGSSSILFCGLERVSAGDRVDKELGGTDKSVQGGHCAERASTLL